LNGEPMGEVRESKSTLTFVQGDESPMLDPIVLTELAAKPEPTELSQLFANPLTPFPFPPLVRKTVFPISLVSLADFPFLVPPMGVPIVPGSTPSVETSVLSSPPLTRPIHVSLFFWARTSLPIPIPIFESLFLLTH
jgi:hypothetical protein